MGKTVEPMKRILQKSIGFEMRQHLFMAEHRDFKPDLFCRKAIDDQIAEIDPQYLEEDDPRKIDKEQVKLE